VSLYILALYKPDYYYYYYYYKAYNAFFWPKQSWSATKWHVFTVSHPHDHPNFTP